MTPDVNKKLVPTVFANFPETTWNFSINFTHLFYVFNNVFITNKIPLTSSAHRPAENENNEIHLKLSKTQNSRTNSKI